MRMLATTTRQSSVSVVLLELVTIALRRSVSKASVVMRVEAWGLVEHLAHCIVIQKAILIWVPMQKMLRHQAYSNMALSKDGLR